MSCPPVAHTLSYLEAADRKARRLLWYRGELSWKLHAGQLRLENAFKNRPGNLFVADCHRQFGKTYWCAEEDVAFALKRPKANIRVGTAFLTDLEQYVIPAFEWVMEDMPDELRPKWTSQKYRYLFPSTGSEIRLVGLDRKPNGLRGNKVHRIDLQEAGFISNLKHLYEYVFIPLTTHVPDAEIIMSSTQPDSPDHDFNYFCDLAAEQGCYIRLDLDSNPFLSEERKEEIAMKYAPHIPGASRAELVALGRASIAFQREYLCRRIVDKEKAIIPEFTDDLVWERPKTEYDKFYHRYFWMDMGVQKDLTVILFVMYDFKGAYAYVEDEIVIRGPTVTTKIIAEAILQKLAERPEYKASYRRIADNSHPLLLNDLGSDYGIHFTATDKEKLHEMVNELRVFTGAHRLRVHPRCVHFIGSMKSGIWDKNRKQFASSPLHGHADAIAAAVYGVRNLDTSTNPVPANYGLDPMTHFLTLQKLQPQRLSDTAKTLQEAFSRRRKG